MFKATYVVRSGRRVTTAAILAATVFAIPLTASAQGTPKGASQSPAAKAEAGSMHSMEMHKMMQKGMKEMEAMPMTGNVDRDFATMMKMHHQGALDMAKIELEHGKDPKMRAMAKRIVDSQAKEIKEFDQWLSQTKQSDSKQSHGH